MARLAHSLRVRLADPLWPASVRARVLAPYRRRRFAAWGEHSVLHKPLLVRSPHRISVGREVMILHGAWLSVEDAAPGTEPALVIGDRVGIRVGCSISVSERVEIGDDVLIAAQCTIVDSDHTMGPNVNPLRNPVVSAPVRIGAGTWIGERVTILRGAHIGRGCVIGAHSVVRGRIPDGSIAVGAPARVVGQVEAATVAAAAGLAPAGSGA